ncbi:23798_t:CDS:2 [Gigaspora margarita]|uniref:23798_t:CDS:1 n=1 Tax=Gigaspora margarita TaxID=4874 RepID=A0ABM8W1A4_GIGMA|nr:23798_t:CDS:2 [Gigaspora margarita]
MSSKPLVDNRPSLWLTIVLQLFKLFEANIGKRKLAQKPQTEDKTENGEGCSKKIKMNNIRMQEGELAFQERPGSQKVGLKKENEISAILTDSQ